MSAETIDIVVKEQGSQQAATNIAGIGTAAAKSSTQVEAFGGVMKEVSNLLLLAGVTFGIKQIFDLDESFHKLENTIKQTASTTKEFHEIEQKLYDISQATRTSFTANVDMYNKLETALAGVDHTTQDTLDTVKNLDKILTASGLSAGEAQGAIQQLAYVMSTGQVSGRGFAEILRTIPTLGQAIASNLGGGAQVSIGRLKEMADEGKITTRVMLDTFRSAGFAQVANNAFANSNITISQAFTVLTNAVTKFVGQLDNANGVSSTLSQGILFLANHIPQIAAGLEIVAGAWLAVKAAALAAAAAEAIASLGFTTIIAAVGAALAWIIQFGQSIKLTADGAISLRGAVVGTFNFIVSSVSDVVRGFQIFGQELLVVGRLIANLYDGSLLQLLVNTIYDAATATAKWLSELYQGSLLQSVVNGIADGFMRLYQIIVDTGVKLGLLSAEGPSLIDKIRGAVDDWHKSMEDASKDPPKLKEAVHDLAQSAVKDLRDMKAAADPFQKAIDDAMQKMITDSVTLKPSFDSTSDAVNTLGQTSKSAFSSMDSGLSSVVSNANSAAAALTNVGRAAAFKQPDWHTMGGVVFNNSGVLTSHDIKGFASGGSFKVGGVGGVDSQLVKFMASPDERVTVETPGQQSARQGGGDVSVHVAMTVNANDANSFHENTNQIAMALQSKLSRAVRSIGR